MACNYSWWGEGGGVLRFSPPAAEKLLSAGSAVEEVMTRTGSAGFWVVRVRGGV